MIKFEGRYAEQNQLNDLAAWCFGVPPVTEKVTGQKFKATFNGHFLTGTVWTSSPERAQVFSTREEAEEALTESRKFNPKAARNAIIVPA